MGSYTRNLKLVVTLQWTGGNQTLGYGQAIWFFPTEQKLLNKIEQVLSTYQVLWRTLKKKFIQASLPTKKNAQPDNEKIFYAPGNCPNPLPHPHKK